MKNFSIPAIVIASAILSCGSPDSVENVTSGKISETTSKCEYSRNETDPGGKLIRVLNEEKFISLGVHDSMKNYATGQELVKGYASCVRVDSLFGIYFSFVIYSDSAHEIYGGISRGDKVEFTLNSGARVEVPFGRTFSGNTNLSLGQTEYSSYGYVSAPSRDLFAAESIKSVSVFWKKRKEDYNVVNPDIFRNQFACLP